VANFRTTFDVVARDMASATFQRVSAGLRGLRGTAAGTTGAVRGLDNATAGMNKRFAAVGVGAGLLRLGRGLTDTLSNSLDIAGQYEQGMAGVGAVTKATAQELKALDEAAIQAGIATQFSPVEAVEGLRELATAGQTATQATQTLVPVLDLAAGSLGQLGVGEASAAVVGTLNAYGLAADQATQTTDKLLRVTQLTNFQARDFGVGLSKAAAMGATFGQNLDDVLITMGLLRNRNIDASSSATAVRESLRRLGSDAGALAEVQSKGIRVFDAQTHEMRSLLDIITDMAAATEKMTGEERQALVARAFGARGLLAFNAVSKATFTTMRDGTEVTLKGAEAIEALRREMSNSAGVAAEFRRQLLSTFEGQRTLLRGTLETMQVVFGKPLAEMLGPVVGLITDTLNSIIRAFKELPGPVQKAIMGFVGLAGTITALVGGFVVFHGVMNLLGISFGGLALTLGKVLLLAGPLVLVLSAIGVGIYGIARTLQRNLGDVAGSWEGLFEKVKLGFQGAIQLVRGQGLSEAVLAELEKVENRGVGRFLKTFAGMLGKAKAFFKGVMAGYDAALARLTAPWERLKAALRETFGEWLGLTRAGTLGISEWERKGQGFGEMLAGMTGVLLDTVTGLLDLGTQIKRAFAGVTMEDVIDGLKGAFEVAQSLGRGVNHLLGLFTRLGDMFSVGTPLRGLWSAMSGNAMQDMSAEDLARTVRVSSTMGRSMQAGREFQDRVGELREAKRMGAFGSGPEADSQFRKRLNMLASASVSKETAIRGGNVEGARGAEMALQVITAEIKKATAALNKAATRPINASLNVDGRQFAEAQSRTQREAWEEDFDAVDGMTVMEGI